MTAQNAPAYERGGMMTDMSMEEFKKAFPGHERGYWWDYYDVIDTFPGVVIIAVDDDDYQGDSRVFLKDGNRLGHLVFGWGSCSGCDALKACDTVEEVLELRNNLARGITWFDTPQEALDWFKTHDWEGDFSWNADETRSYIAMVIEYLMSEGCVWESE